MIMIMYMISSEEAMRTPVPQLTPELLLHDTAACPKGRKDKNSLSS
jgi:hypothetical protein